MPESPSGERKGLAVASLVLGLLSLPTLGLLGVGALLSIVLGIAALVKAREAPRVYGGKALAVVGIVCAAASVLVAPFVLGIVAAIAIPSLLRARVSANEAATLGDVRTVVSAQLAYAASNRGRFGSLECLHAPQGCLPPGSPTTFLGAELLRSEKSGYRRRFYPGVEAGERGAGQEGKHFKGFAYVATPIQPGQTGVRAFCGDSRGRVCFTASPEMALDEANPSSCPEACQDFR